MSDSVGKAERRKAKLAKREDSIRRRERASLEELFKLPLHERAAALEARARKKHGLPPRPKTLPPFTGTIFVCDSPTSWLVIDTLDPSLLPERVQLVTAVRTGKYIPPVNVGSKDLDMLKSNLPKGCGVGRYYLLVQPRDNFSAWLDVTDVVEQES